MNDLINITYDSERPTISGRELHAALEVNSNYTTWFKRMCEYGFTENEDFKAIFQKWNTAQGNETTQTDHQITIDMAKEICMLQRSEKGKQFRQYFIEVEKKWNTPEAVMSRALQMANRKLEEIRSMNVTLSAKIEEDKPKVVFADAVATSKTSILIGDLAKLLAQNGIKTGQKRLFEWLRENGYLMKSGASINMPTQYSMDLKLFEVKESVLANPDGSTRTTRTTKVTGKGQQYFINKFLGGESNDR